MALALFDRVQETTTTTGTGSVTLAGAVPGFQSFAVVGNGNTCYYTIVDGSAWEVGTGTYSTSGPTLARTTVLSNSNGNTSPITLAAGTKSVFLTYPAGKSVNLNESGNVSPLGTVSSGVWQGTTVGVAYGGTGVTASSGANSVVLRDASQNITVNRINQGLLTTTASGGTTTLTAASAFNQALVGTGGHTYRLPDATTLSDTTTFQFNNNATGTLTIQNNAGTAVGTIASGGAAGIALLSNATVGGTWDVHAYIPENVTWGTNSLALGSTVISGGTWQGGTIQPAYGGTGLTSYTSGGAVYANSSTTLTSGTLPISAGGTGATTAAGAQSSLNVPSTTGSGASGTWGINISGNAATATNSSTTSQTNFSNLTIGGSQVLYAGNYNSYAVAGAGFSTNQNLNTSNQVTFDSVVTGNNGNGTNFRLGDDAWIGDVNIANTTRLQGVQSAASGYLIFGNGDNTALGRAGTGALTYGGNNVLTAANYNSYAPTLTGTGATGTWAINISGNAATATNASNSNTVANITPPQFFNNMGNEHGTYTNFNSVGDFGFRYLQGSTNGPGTGATQYYGMTIGLGSQYSLSQYASQFYWNRTSTGGNPYVSVRFLESGSWGSWSKIYAGYADTAGSAGSVDYNALTNKGGGTGSYITSGDYRAPIFYDSNNTAYYGDFASTSQFNEATFAGYIGLGGSTPTARMSGTSGISIYNANYPSVGFSTPSGPDYLIYRLGNAGALAVWNSSGYETVYFYTAYTQFTGSARAPIFYDSNNTNYYVDLASTSQFNLGRFVIPVYGGGSGVYADDRMTLSVGGSGLGSIVYQSQYNSPSYPDYGMVFIHGAAGGNRNVWSISPDGPAKGDSLNFLYDINSTNIHVGTTRFRLDGSGNSFSSASSRAPIFYDSNNTAYYVDPNSTSVLYNLSMSNYATTSLAYPGILNIGDINYNYNFLNGTWPSSITAGLLANCADQWEMAIHDSGTRVVSPIFFQGGASNNYILMGRDIGWGATPIQAASSFIAPIFYDSNNTAYYFDPASGSRQFSTFDIAADGSTGYVASRLYLRSHDNYRGAGVFMFGTGSSWFAGTPYTDFSGQYIISRIAAANDEAAANPAYKLFWVDSSGNAFTTSSMRAPIFYDSNNTAYYVDPAGTTYLSTTNLQDGKWYTVNNQSGQSINIYVRPNGDNTYVWRHIYGGTGTGFGTGVGGYGIYNETLAGDYSILFNPAGFVTSPYSFRAPIFYDSSNTNFYLNPDAMSSLYGVAIRGDQSSTDSINQIFFWGSGDTTTSAIGFKANGGEFPNPTGFGDGYNTYLTMDSDGRGWVFRRGVGGSDFNAAYTSGWILNNGVWQANASMRAPIFYDSNDTGYFIDPSNGGFNLRGGTSNRVTYSTNDSGFLVVNAEGNGVSDMRLGAAWGAPGIYSSSDLYLMSGASAVYWKLNNDNKGYMDTSANLFAFGSMRSPIFYDSNNTGFYVDPASSSILNSLNLTSGVLSLSGVNIITRGGTWTEFRDPSGATKFWLGNDSSIYMNASNYYLRSNDSSATFVDINSSLLQHSTSLRAPIFYDSNNTAYYLDPASGSRINAITFDRLSSTAYDTPNQLVTASDTNWTFGCFNSGSTYFMQVKFYGTNDDTRGFRVFDTATSIVVWRVNGAGNSIASGNVTAYSDERLKTNWQPMPENYVSRLAQIKVGIYDRIDGSKLTQVGVGAQSLQTLLPQAVDKSDDEMGTLSVSYGSAALASAVELAKYVTALEQRISQLEARL